MTFCSKLPVIIDSLIDGMSRLLSSCYISPMYSLSNELISCVQIKRGKEYFNGDSTTTKNPCGCHFITTGSFLSPHAQNAKKNFDVAGIKPGPLVWGKVKWSEHLGDENVNVGVWDSWGMTIHKLALQATTPPITPGLPGTASKWDIGLARHRKKLPVTFYLIVQGLKKKFSRVTWSLFASKWIRPKRTFVDCFHLKLKAMHITTIPLFQILKRISKWRSLFNWAKMKEQHF